MFHIPRHSFAVPLESYSHLLLTTLDSIYRLSYTRYSKRATMDTEPFTLIEESGNKPFHLFDSVVHFNSAKRADQDLQYITALRKAFPGLIVTACPESNAPLRYFAAAGFADCELDKETDSFARSVSLHVTHLRSPGDYDCLSQTSID